MKRNPYYQLKYIAGIPYLLTYGQGHADFLRDLKLNDTGAFLWEHIDKISDIEGLVTLCSGHYHCTEDQLPFLHADITAFVEALRVRGILLEDATVPQNSQLYTRLNIAELFCHIHAPEYLLAPELLSFAVSDDIPSTCPFQTIHILNTPPTLTENGSLILRNDTLAIVEKDDKFVLFFPASPQIKEAHINKDGTYCTIYCAPDISAEDTTEISYVIRILFFYFSLQHQIVALHSASILYRDKLWLFSAASGTGKSTHAELWHSLIHTPIINGDINLITFRQGTPTVYGNPWCGTSGIYDTHNYPLGGVILLKQGLQNQITHLSDDQKELFLLHRSISPTWTANLLDANHNVIKSLCHRILTCRLTCTASEDAVLCCKQTIDLYLDKT